MHQHLLMLPQPLPAILELVQPSMCNINASRAQKPWLQRTILLKRQVSSAFAQLFFWSRLCNMPKTVFRRKPQFGMPTMLLQQTTRCTLLSTNNKSKDGNNKLSITSKTLLPRECASRSNLLLKLKDNAENLPDVEIFGMFLTFKLCSKMLKSSKS
jgi:hypothetical protein